MPGSMTTSRRRTRSRSCYDATPKQLAIMVLLAAWCQLRRAECLGLQRRDIEWLADGGAILHVRRQLSANTGDYSSELKSEAGKRSLAVPRLMLDRLEAHLRDHVAAEAKAPLVPTNVRGSVPLFGVRREATSRPRARPRRPLSATRRGRPEARKRSVNPRRH